MSVLRYENVDISYNGNTVVKDINFKLDEGEILGIVGESGSGKSTVLKAAMNLLGKGGLVTRGDIWFKDMDIPDLSDKQMRKINGPEIGMIFQNSGSAFCPIRTVGDQLYEAMCAHERISKAEFKNKATELFEKIGFKCEKVLSVSNFRSRKLKKIFGTDRLVKMENSAQQALAGIRFAPSIYYKLRKPED